MFGASVMGAPLDTSEKEAVGSQYETVLQRGGKRNQIFFGGGCIPPRRDRNKPKGGCLGVYWTPSVA